MYQTMEMIFKHNKISLYQSTSLSVSECVCLFPNSTETANLNDLKFWGMIPLGMEKVLD